MSKMGQWIIEQEELGNIEWDDRNEEYVNVRTNHRRRDSNPFNIKFAKPSARPDEGRPVFRGVTPIRTGNLIREAEDQPVSPGQQAEEIHGESD